MKNVCCLIIILTIAAITAGCNTSTSPGLDPQLSVLSKIEGAKKIHFINANTGWALCIENKIYKTINGGKSWHSINITTTETVTNIQFADENNGWCSTYNSIYKTADAGKTWELILENKSKNAFITMNLVNKDFGFVSGTNDAMVYSTQNGGKSWNLIDLNANGKVNNIQFTSGNSGWAAEALGRIYRTNNKGVNWIETSPIKFTNCIYALDEQTCYAGNCSYVSSRAEDIASVFRTENGGQSWIDLKLPNSEMVEKIVFSNKIRGCVLADIGNFSKVGNNSIFGAQKLIYTSDAGMTWHIFDTNNIPVKDICTAGNRLLVLLWDDKLLEITD